LFSLTSSFFTIRAIIKTCSKIISHSLRSIPIEGEYRLSANDLLIRGEISPEASAKIHGALPFAELPPQPFFGADDCPGACSNMVPSVASVELSFSFLFFDPPAHDSGCDVEASK
jgi:hypothetical protein